ncbi:MAG: 5-methyltetrahydropteroyltriglutamate--homocysteine S-methyltransferase, partial [Pseudomonadota bacterium]|nr:5-methyltetrahydropteroyltriglutamate--homocysteine S-methyltransferase [Pseudomonadota bacterium]
DGLIKRGDDPDEMVKTFATAISKSIAERPEDMVITTHMCRGNFQSTWMTQGGYEPVAELMFDNLINDGFFMEYDTERAGDFEPLRFAHEDQHIVLGLISSKVAQLENKDQIKRQIEKATNYIPIDRLSLSPQCGFSSTHHGNNLTLDDQKRKLELLVQIAIDIWGEI